MRGHKFVFSIKIARTRLQSCGHEKVLAIDILHARFNVSESPLDALAGMTTIMSIWNRRSFRCKETANKGQIIARGGLSLVSMDKGPNGYKVISRRA